MKTKKRYIIIIILSFILFLIGGAWTLYKSYHEQQIREKFSSTLGMYPIKNLEDLYDKEGHRDENFDKDDKGQWILSSSFVHENRSALTAEGMTLYLDRNTKKAHGFYFIDNIYEDEKGAPTSHEKKYPVKLKNNKIILTKKVNDTKLKDKIESFKFFSQYAIYKDLSSYTNGNFSYNSNVPIYTVEYQLSNEDYNVKQLREKYNIPTKKAPKLELQSTGNSTGTALSYKREEFIFNRKEYQNLGFTNNLNFKPTR